MHMHVCGEWRVIVSSPLAQILKHFFSCTFLFFIIPHLWVWFLIFSVTFPNKHALFFPIETESEFPQSSGVSTALALVMRARQQAEQEGDSPPLNRKTPSDSSTMAQIKMAREQAERDTDQPSYIVEPSTIERVMSAKHQAMYKEQPPRHDTGPSNAMEMVMRARQQAEYEEQQQNYATNAMEMAMKARQQAGHEDQQQNY